MVIVDPTSLSEAAKKKVEKYIPIMKTVKDFTGKSSVSLFGFPVGGRGT